MASVSQITVDNQGFSAFRTAMNNSLNALNTLSSASSAPGSKAAGSLWLDTTSATTPTLKFYDGSDWISLCTFDYSANTVNWLDSTVSLGADSVDSDQYVDGSIDRVHLAADIIDGTKIDDDVIDSEHYVAASIDNEHLADDAVGLAEMASGTDGNIISYDASGNPVAVATGTDGQVLTSAGAGAVCAFEDASGGTNTPYFKITNHNTAQTISTATGTVIEFASTTYDTASGHDTTNDKYVVQTGDGGTWFIYVRIGYHNPATLTGARICYVRVNGGAMVEFSNNTRSNAGHDTWEGSIIRELADGDEIDVSVIQTSGGDLVTYPISGNNLYIIGFKLIT